MIEALTIIKDAMLTIIISILLVKISNGDEHAVEKLLCIVLLFSF